MVCGFTSIGYLLHCLIFAVSAADPEKVLAPSTWAFGAMLLGAFFCYEICRKLDPHIHPILGNSRCTFMASAKLLNWQLSR